MTLNIRRAVAAGVAGTIVMTVIGVFVAPVMGIPKMNPADMLAGQMGGMLALGYAAHFMIGIVLAVGYAVVAPALPSAAPLRGALYSVAPWLMAQLAVMPMMGMGVFSGSMVMAGGSLLGHLMYGATVGAIYGASPPAARLAHA
jgi:uncharacterized membrane protein YagU involved in acid resistance